MCVHELTETIDHFLRQADENQSSVDAVLFGLEKSSGYLYKIDVDSSETQGIALEFLNSIKQFLGTEGLSYILYSAADERKKAIYEYDLEFPEEFSFLETARTSAGIQNFNFSVQSIRDLSAVVVKIGNAQDNFFVYKSIAPINIFDRKKMFYMAKTNRLERIPDDFLRLDSNFQMLYICDKLFIKDISAIEKVFGFYDVIEKEASIAACSIKSLSIFHNPNVFDEMISNLTFARKMINISKNSPVMRNNIPPQQILQFCLNHGPLQGKFKFDSTNLQLLLKSKKEKQLFLKVMMDDLLTSNLTTIEYDSLAKDPLQ